jgi:hypothetical protein
VIRECGVLKIYQNHAAVDPTSQQLIDAVVRPSATAAFDPDASLEG